MVRACKPMLKLSETFRFSSCPDQGIWLDCANSIYVYAPKVMTTATERDTTTTSWLAPMAPILSDHVPTLNA